MWLRVLSAELKRGIIIQLRHPVQLLSEMLGVSIFFFIINHGGQAIGKIAGASDISGGVDAAQIFAFIASFMAIVGLQTPHKTIRDDAQSGTFEQVYPSSIGLPALLVIRNLADSIRMVLIMSFIGAAISAVSGKMNLNIICMFPLAFVVNLSTIGLGLMLGAAALAFRRTGGLVNVASIVVFSLINSVSAEKYESWIWSALAPFATLTRSVMYNASSMIDAPSMSNISSITNVETIIALAASLIYFCLGVVVLRLGESFARKHGLLFQY